MAPNPAAQTAFGPMVLAAIEQLEVPERRLVDDDLAESFLPGRLRAVVRLARFGPLRRMLIAASDRSGPGLWASVVCRKRYIDEKVSDPVSEIDAVVILGSGLDTRPYRIARYSDLPVHELDQPVNIERKTAAVQRALGGVPASVHLAGVDFEHDNVMSVLADNGFRDTGRTLFIWEGVTQYLTPEALHRTFEQLRAVTPGSRLVFTYVRQDFIDGTNLHGAGSVYRRFRRRSQVWKSGLEPERVEETLRGYGWRVLEQVGPSYYRDLYIRPTGRTISASPIEWTALAVRSD
ncbi:SAM-dependent methyltransferase [Mycobacterium sp. ITM-2016-00316]|uniref:SAM-dependent methyltransferase n=1 Tax=Mycobacterium sp. ITM-2016-00316 TaxID=2099695 RepID=UPI000CF9940A|nr:SAM-dependent methyltransferase [Mycobacterium sp. ITM-2016-00316]WNG84195.1 SAM-dependent methyltransferase [Mycobacterium sp. ITM-2016-00316]